MYAVHRSTQAELQQQRDLHVQGRQAASNSKSKQHYNMSVLLLVLPRHADNNVGVHFVSSPALETQGFRCYHGHGRGARRAEFKHTELVSK
jgi:hypothetical protein